MASSAWIQFSERVDFKKKKKRRSKVSPFTRTFNTWARKMKNVELQPTSPKWRKGSRVGSHCYLQGSRLFPFISAHYENQYVQTWSSKSDCCEWVFLRRFFLHFSSNLCRIQVLSLHCQQSKVFTLVTFSLGIASGCAKCPSASDAEACNGCDAKPSASDGLNRWLRKVRSRKREKCHVGLVFSW